MKATLKGVLNLRVLDEWWIKGCTEGVTGWPIQQTRNAGTPNSVAYTL